MKRLIILLLLIVVFGGIGYGSLRYQNHYLNKNSRISLISNIEKSPQFQKMNLNLKGDYIAVYDGKQTRYNLLYINPKLTLFDSKNKTYASAGYWKEHNYHNYLKLLAQNFNLRNSEPENNYPGYLQNFNIGKIKNEVSEYFLYSLKSGKVTTNVKAEAKEIYKNSYLEIQKNKKTIETDGANYHPDESTQFLNIFKEFNYDSTSLVNSGLIATFNHNYYQKDSEREKKFYNAYIKVYTPSLKYENGYYKYYQNIKSIIKEINVNNRYKIKYTNILAGEYSKKLKKQKNIIKQKKEKMIANKEKEEIKKYQNLENEK